MFTSIFSCYRVCRKWNVLTRSPILWRRVDVILYEHRESQTEAVKKLIAILSCCVTHISLDFRDIYSWTERLNFSELSVRLQEKCPHLETFILEDAKLSESLLLVIDLCTRLLQNIKVLVVRFSEFPDSPAKTEFDGISEIEVLDVSWCDFGLFNQPPFSKMTYLKQLRVADTKVDDSWFEADTSFLDRLEVLDLGRTEIGCQTFRSIRNHGENLRELYLCWVNLQDNDLKFSNSLFPHLKTICLRYCCTLTCEDVVSLIQSCHSLKKCLCHSRSGSFFRSTSFYWSQ